MDVRIIAATHRDLLTHVQENKFREDLFYRLNVFPIEVPPLRDRGNDICLIAEEMMAQFAKKLSKPMQNLSEADKHLLRDYSWPGNVRELQNLVERAVIISKHGEVHWSQMIPSLTSEGISSKEKPMDDKKVLTHAAIIDYEKANILKALKTTNWKISGKNGAAALLQMAPTTLASKIKALGISRPI